MRSQRLNKFLSCHIGISKTKFRFRLWRDQISLNSDVTPPKAARREIMHERSECLSGDGFTLVEVLVAVMVISVAVLGTLLTFTKSNQMMTQLRELTVADQCIKEEIESIRDMDYDNILSLGSTFNSEGFSSLNNVAGTRTIDDPFGDPNIRRITIDVTWDSPDGRALNLNRATLVTRDGINKQ